MKKGKFILLSKKEMAPVKEVEKSDLVLRINKKGTKVEILKSRYF